MPRNEKEIMLEKAANMATDLTDGEGKLLPEQKDKFLTNMVDESVMLQIARVEPMDRDTMHIPKMNIWGRVTHKHAEGQGLAANKRVKASYGQIKLVAEELTVEWEFTYQYLRANIEKKGFTNTMMKSVSIKHMNDLEELLISGDVDSSDEFLTIQDWILKRMVTGWHALAWVDRVLNKDFLYDLQKELPSKYRKNPENLAYFMNIDDVVDYKKTLTDRETEYSEELIAKKKLLTHSGIKIVPVPFLPKGTVILTVGKNIILWDYADGITLETDKDIRSKVIFYVLTNFVAFAIEETDAIAYTTDVSTVSG